MSILRASFRLLSRACLAAALTSALLTACGGGGGGGGGGGTLEAPAAPTGLVVTYDVKAYAFTWDATPGATHYQFFEDPDGPAPQESVHVGGDLTGNSFTVVLATLLDGGRLNAQYAVKACNAVGCSPLAASVQPDLVKAIGYFKASNTKAGHLFGNAVALSMDGTTLAVGAPGDDSGSAGVNQPETTTPALPLAGAVHVYMRSADGVWSRQAYLKASNSGQGDAFGTTLALSADGNTLAVGATGEDGSGKFVNSPTESDDSKDDSGAVYVFGRSATGAWSQQAYVKASNTRAGDSFGGSVALSSDGRTLAVGAPNERGDGANPDSNALLSAGAAYVYRRDGAGTWSFQKYLKAGNPHDFAKFGSAVALSGTGDILAVGSVGEDTFEVGSGGVFMFAHDGMAWSEQQLIKASNRAGGDLFGYAIALSADGGTLAVGAPGEASKATGVNNDKSNDDLPAAGAVYVYVRGGAQWGQETYIKASNTGGFDQFGTSVHLSSDGSKLVVGAPTEDSAAQGMGGVQGDDTAANTGAAYIFNRSGGDWLQQSYVKASNNRRTGDPRFGSVALSGDGKTVAVGAPREDGRSTGIQGDQGAFGLSADFNAGAVYLY